MKNPKVSIIVPVYNAEPYIAKCVSSLLAQTYDNIEFIFIDDASTDNSLAILKSVTDKHSRNTVILCNNTNRGSSYSRNIGIEHSTGDFITFCDSDDWMEPAGVEDMVNAAFRENADVVVTSFYTNCFEKERIHSFSSPDFANLNSCPIDFKHFSLWNKLIKASIIKENHIYSLPGVNCWEDLSIISRIYALAPKIILLDKPFYHYRIFEHLSLSNSSHEIRLKDHLQYAEFLVKWFKQHNLDKKYKQFLNHLKFTSKIKMLRTIPRQFRRWKRTFPESNHHIMTYTDIPMFYRILFYAADLIIRP